MSNLHLSSMQGYFVVSAIFLPINLIGQIVHFRRKEKELAPPADPTHSDEKRPPFKPSYGALQALTFFWPITFLFGYLGFMWDSSPWTVANPRPWTRR